MTADRSGDVQDEDRELKAFLIAKMALTAELLGIRRLLTPWDVSGIGNRMFRHKLNRPSQETPSQVQGE